MLIQSAPRCGRWHLRTDGWKSERADGVLEETTNERNGSIWDTWIRNTDVASMTAKITVVYVSLLLVPGGFELLTYTCRLNWEDRGE